MAARNIEILCPCCEATIVIERETGEILLHKQKERPAGAFSLESMVSNLESQRTESARKFEKQIESQKDRSRLLEEKFKEALERADKSDKRPFNPMDMD